MGRPSKLNSINAEPILRALELGSSIEQAARCANVSTSTLRRWRQLGRRDVAGGKYSAFLAEFERMQHRSALFAYIHVRNVARERSLAAFQVAYDDTYPDFYKKFFNGSD